MIKALCLILSTVFTGASFAHAEIQTYAVIGDAGLWNDNTHRVRDSILNSRIQSLVLPGDNLYDPKKTYDETWRPWRLAGFRFDVVAVGNHLRSYDEEVRYFEMPGEYYTRSRNGVLWIVLNSDNEATAVLQEQWLSAVLSRAKEKTIFLTFHHPTYTVTPFHPWTEKRRFQEGLRRVLWQYRNRVTALVVGHDHVASLLKLNEIPMIVSGAAMEQRDAAPVNYAEAGTLVQTQWLYPGRPHWTRLDVDSLSGETWVNFVDVDLNFVDCSVRVSPRPFLFRDNCAKSNRRAFFPNDNSRTSVSRN